MLERHAASYDVNPEIRGPQMHKHTTWEMQVDVGNRPMDLIYKTKSFCSEKWSLMEHIDGLVFTLGICMCGGVGEDSGHGIG